MSNTSLLAVTISIFTLTIGSLRDIGKPRKIKVAGIFLAVIGMIILIDPRNTSFSSEETTRGDLLIVLNWLSFGIYVVTSKSVITHNGEIRSIVWIFIFASIICVPLSAYPLSAVDVATITPTIWTAILYIALVSTTLPYSTGGFGGVNLLVVAVFIYL